MEYVDILYVHVYDHLTPDREVLRGLDDLVKKGLVHYLGVSDTPAWVVSRWNTLAEENGWTQFTLYQGRHNIGDRAMERDIVPMCRKLGLAIAPWNVLGVGKYLGKYDRKDGVPQKIRSNTITAKDFDIQDVILKIAKEINRTPAQVLINWELQVPGITSPIIGNRTFAQFEDNLKALDFTLSQEHLDELYKIAEFPIDFPYDFIGPDWQHGIIAMDASRFD